MNYYVDVLKKYAVFDGRATRREFWMFTLWNIIISIALGIVLGIIASATGSNTISLLSWVYTLGVFLPSLGVSIRRLHDTSRSGWWVLIGIIPIIGFIIFIIFAAQDSQPDNQYGPNPKGIVSAPDEVPPSPPTT